MCRRTLSDKVTERYNATKETLLSKLSVIDIVSTTADLWTSRRRSFMGITCHWLCPTSLRRRSACLSIRRMKGTHSFDVIAGALESVNNEYDIGHKISVTITDSGSNFLKAFRLFSRKEDTESEYDSRSSTLSSEGNNEVVYQSCF